MEQLQYDVCEKCQSLKVEGQPCPACGEQKD
jgi:RNA polymerase subunit RPABC4/transcription elongation factor Spt4